MKSYLWTAALVLAAFVSVLTGSGAGRPGDSDESMDPEARKQMVWDMQIKYAALTAVVVAIGAGSFWVLSKANQGKKKFAEDLKKQEHLDPNEGMPLT